MAMNKSLALKFDRDKILQFFKDKKNRPYIILGGLLLLAAVIAAASLINLDSMTDAKAKAAGTQSPAAGGTAAILPETTRTNSAADTAAQAGEKTMDPFAGPMALKGIMLGGGASDLAIIEMGDTTFVAGKNTVIANTWTVSEINSKQVILTNENEKLRLELGGRVKTEAAVTEPAAPAASQTGGEAAQ